VDGYDDTVNLAPLCEQQPSLFRKFVAAAVVAVAGAVVVVVVVVVVAEWVALQLVTTQQA